MPRSLAQKPQQGRIRWWSYAKAKPESGSKEHLPQTANSWSRNKWKCPAQQAGTGARQDDQALAPTRDAPDTALSSPWHPWCRHCAVPGPCGTANIWGLSKSKAAKMLFLGYSKGMEGESLLVGGLSGRFSLGLCYCRVMVLLTFPTGPASQAQALALHQQTWLWMSSWRKH